MGMALDASFEDKVANYLTTWLWQAKDGMACQAAARDIARMANDVPPVENAPTPLEQPPT